MKLSRSFGSTSTDLSLGNNFQNFIIKRGQIVPASGVKRLVEFTVGAEGRLSPHLPEVLEIVRRTSTRNKVAVNQHLFYSEIRKVRYVRPRYSRIEKSVPDRFGNSLRSLSPEAFLQSDKREHTTDALIPRKAMNANWLLSFLKRRTWELNTRRPVAQ
jgi:hypothetical protein